MSMIIKSRTAGMINGVKLKIGTARYDFDPKDPSTAMQLEVLRDQAKTIEFDEKLPCDMNEEKRKAMEKKVEARAAIARADAAAAAEEAKKKEAAEVKADAAAKAEEWKKKHAGKSPRPAKKP